MGRQQGPGGHTWSSRRAPSRGATGRGSEASQPLSGIFYPVPGSLCSHWFCLRLSNNGGRYQVFQCADENICRPQFPHVQRKHWPEGSCSSGCLRFYDMASSGSRQSREGQAGQASAQQSGGRAAERVWRSGSRSERCSHAGEVRGGVGRASQSTFMTLTVCSTLPFT